MISIERKTVLHLIHLYTKAIEDCKDMSLKDANKYLCLKDMNMGICNWLFNDYSSNNLYFIPRHKVMKMCKPGHTEWARFPMYCHNRKSLLHSLRTRLIKLKKMLDEKLYR